MVAVARTEEVADARVHLWGEGEGEGEHLWGERATRAEASGEVRVWVGLKVGVRVSTFGVSEPHELRLVSKSRHAMSQTWVSTGTTEA